MTKRIITALVLFVIVIASLFAGADVFYFVMALAFMCALYEWLVLAQLSKAHAALIALVDFTLLGSLCVLVHNTAGGPGGESALIHIIPTLLAGFFLIVVCFWLCESVKIFRGRSTGFTVPYKRSVVLGIIAVPGAWLAFYLIAELFDLIFVFSVLCVVWIADIMALFSGMAFGRHKMCTAISPKKTWEGALGGFLSVLIIGTLAGYFYEGSTLPRYVMDFLGFFGWFFVSFALVAFSITGDLFESVLKRQAGVKDSGRILPGHGGFFDRLDAMMPALPLALVLCIAVAYIGYPGY